jgi:hypothetical protein
MTFYFQTKCIILNGISLSINSQGKSTSLNYLPISGTPAALPGRGRNALVPIQLSSVATIRLARSFFRRIISLIFFLKSALGDEPSDHLVFLLTDSVGPVGGLCFHGGGCTGSVASFLLT